MATAATRHLKVGRIIDKALGVLERAAVPALLYVAVIGGINVGVTWFSLGITAILDALGIMLATVVVSIAATYWLLETMLRSTELAPRPEGEVLPFFALWILYSLGAGAAFLVVIIPGLLVMARWSIAQPLFVARGGSVTKALGESWERTSGAEFQIIGATLALLIPLIGVMIACAVMFERTDIVGIVVSQIAGSSITVVGTALSVALYGLIEHTDASVFE